MLINQSIFVWFVILSQTLFRSCADCHSGWFVDNGISQTVLEEPLPIVAVQHLQDTILDLLGLPNQPLRERFPSTIRFVDTFYHPLCRNERCLFHRCLI